MKAQIVGMAYLVMLAAAASAEAQGVAGSFSQLKGLLRPGDTVWVTDEAKREIKGRIADLTESALVLTAGHGLREFSARDVTRIRQRRPDSVANGALIGAAAAAAPLIWWFAPMTETGETASENMGFIALMVGAGAGAGAGIDALIQGRKTIYLAPADSSPVVRVSPLLSRNVKGVRASVSF